MSATQKIEELSLEQQRMLAEAKNAQIQARSLYSQALAQWRKTRVLMVRLNNSGVQKTLMADYLGHNRKSFDRKFRN